MTSENIVTEYVYYAMPVQLDPVNCVGITTDYADMIVMSIVQGVGGYFNLPANTLFGTSGTYNITLTPQAYISWYNATPTASQFPALQMAYNTFTGPSYYPNQYSSYMAQVQAWLDGEGYYWVPYSPTLSSSYQMSSNLNSPLTVGNSQYTDQLYALVKNVSSASSVYQSLNGTSVTAQSTSQATQQAENQSTGNQYVSTSLNTNYQNNSLEASTLGQSVLNASSTLNDIGQSISSSLSKIGQGISADVSAAEKQAATDLLYTGLAIAGVSIAGIGLFLYLDKRGYIKSG